MKQTINQSQFIDGFREANRENQFSYNGKVALYDYLTQLEEDIGEDIEFDVIALCCEYNEYESIEEFLKDYSNSYDSFEEWLKNNDGSNYDDYKQYLEDEISNHTTLIKFSDDLEEGFIIEAY